MRASLPSGSGVMRELQERLVDQLGRGERGSGAQPVEMVRRDALQLAIDDREERVGRVGRLVEVVGGQRDCLRKPGATGCLVNPP